MICDSVAGGRWGKAGGWGGVGEGHVSPVSWRLVWALKTVEWCAEVTVLSRKSRGEKKIWDS